MYHKSKDYHHGSIAIVVLNGMLFKLGLLIEAIPANVNVSIMEITNVLVLSSGNIMHEHALKDTNEGNDLNKASSWDRVGAKEGGNTFEKESKESPA